MTGLGLALAQPKLPVIVVSSDNLERVLPTRDGNNILMRLRAILGDLDLKGRSL